MHQILGCQGCLMGQGCRCIPSCLSPGGVVLSVPSRVDKALTVMLTSPSSHPHLCKGQIRARLSQQQPFCIQPCSGVPMRGLGAEVQDSSSPWGLQQMFNAARAKPFVNLIKSNGVCLLFQMLGTLMCIKYLGCSESLRLLHGSLLAQRETQRDFI